MATAKGLALSLGVPIIGISTLEADAYQHAETGLPVYPIFNAGRGEIATAVYQMKASKWLQITPEHITTLDALCSEISEKTVFCGEYIREIATELKLRLKQKAVIPTPAARLRRAGFLAELGQKRFEAGDFDNVSTLQPIYLRKPPITKPKKQY
jgi:tRNA threonylcarbamoyladenosine biosynthesis protein TsaB